MALLAWRSCATPRLLHAPRPASAPRPLPLPLLLPLLLPAHSTPGGPTSTSLAAASGRRVLPPNPPPSHALSSAAIVCSISSPSPRNHSGLGCFFPSPHTRALPVLLQNRIALCSDNQEEKARGAPWAAAAAGSPPDVVQFVRERIEHAPVVVFSKSYCPYCAEVKDLFQHLKVDALVLELDEFEEEGAIQGALSELTGQRTVPNVFIGGQHIGGCDATTALHREGKLVPLLEAAGVSAAS